MRSKGRGDHVVGTPSKICKRVSRGCRYWTSTYEEHNRRWKELEWRITKYPSGSIFDERGPHGDPFRFDSTINSSGNVNIE